MTKRLQSSYYLDEGGGITLPKSYGLGGSFWEENWVEHRILEIKAGIPKSVTFERKEGEWYSFGKTEKHTFCQYRIDFEDIQLVFQPSCQLLELGYCQYLTIIFKKYLFGDKRERKKRYDISCPDEAALRHFHLGNDIFIIHDHKPFLKLMGRLHKAHHKEHWKYRGQCHYERGNYKVILEDIKSWAIGER